MRESKKHDTGSTEAPTLKNRLNVRCDAAISAWDRSLAGMYLETLHALSRLRIN